MGALQQGHSREKNRERNEVEHCLVAHADCSFLKTDAIIARLGIESNSVTAQPHVILSGAKNLVRVGTEILRRKKSRKPRGTKCGALLRMTAWVVTKFGGDWKQLQRA